MHQKIFITLNTLRVNVTKTQKESNASASMTYDYYVIFWKSTKVIE